VNESEKERMKMWALLLCVAIASVLAIWCCNVIVDMPEQEQGSFADAKVYKIG